jgi:hypothetical protein
MGDIWNPFDNNNPVYVKLAKEMGARRHRVKSGFWILAGAIFITAYSQRNLLGIGGRVNQFGVVRRK